MKPNPAVPANPMVLLVTVAGLARLELGFQLLRGMIK
jgi:hypothetical protein